MVQELLTNSRMKAYVRRLKFGRWGVISEERSNRRKMETKRCTFEPQNTLVVWILSQEEVGQATYTELGRKLLSI